LVTWKTKKAILYFGGTFVILLGGTIILLAPYPYRWFLLRENEPQAFTMHDGPSYYPELEITLIVTHMNGSEADASISFRSNNTQISRLVNMTVTSSDSVGPTTAIRYQKSTTIDLDFDDYTLTIVGLNGTQWAEIELTQTTDFRLYIITGGSLNIIGLMMGFSGYMVSGSLLPTSDDFIVDWGYEDQDEDDKETLTEQNPP
jgi:hypothetical protein